MISGELDSVVTEDGTSYKIEKYCYSNPSNMAGVGGQSMEAEGKIFYTRLISKMFRRLSLTITDFGSELVLFVFY